MNSYEASQQILSAIDSLKSVRDTLAEQLCDDIALPDLNDTESRRLSALHNRSARIISAYYKAL